MGKKIIIKDADFSANGFVNIFVNPDKLRLDTYGTLTSTGTWSIASGSTNFDNMFLLCSIPSSATKLVVDATTINPTTHTKTADNLDDSMIAFLTGSPTNRINGEAEPTFIEKHIVPIGTKVEIDIPNNAAVLFIHTGYWKKNPFSFHTSRLAKSMYMTNV